MNFAWVLKVKADLSEEISTQIWEIPGVLGIEECPTGGPALFLPTEDFEILEFSSDAAKRCAQWLDDEGYKEGKEILLRVYIDPPSDFDSQAWAKKIPAVTFVSWHPLVDTDYLEAYKKTVRGSLLNDKLWVGPPWDSAPPGAVAFKVEAGLAFGTGEHPTTQLCLIRLQELSEGGEKFSKILDLGTGSGVLAAAAKIFYPVSKVTATDLDPLCAHELTKTLNLNGLSADSVEGYFGNSGTAQALVKRGLKFDLVISNIYSEVLLSLIGDIAELLNEGGRWLVSGVLDDAAGTQLKKAAEKDFARIFERSQEREQVQLDRQQGMRKTFERWLCLEFVKETKT